MWALSDYDSSRARHSTQGYSGANPSAAAAPSPPLSSSSRIKSASACILSTVLLPYPAPPPPRFSARYRGDGRPLAHGVFSGCFRYCCRWCRTVWISPSDKDLAMLPFETAERTCPKRTGFTWLGICRAAAEPAGGNIRLGSGPVQNFQQGFSRKACPRSNGAFPLPHLLKPPPGKIPATDKPAVLLQKRQEAGLGKVPLAHSHVQLKLGGVQRGGRSRSSTDAQGRP